MAKHFSSIRTKLLLFIAITLFFSLMMAMTGMYLFQKSTLTGQTVERAEEIGGIINTGLKYQMLKRDFELTQRIINEISAHKNVLSAFIINAQGMVKFSSRPEQVDSQLSKSNKQCLPCHDGANNEARLTLHKKDVAHAFRHESALTNVTLIYNEKSCFGCHPAQQKTLGHLFIDYSTAGMDSLIATTMLRMLATAFVTLIIMTLAILYLINRWLHKPITILMDGVSELKKGHYGSQIDYRGNTEFQVLTDSFNVMSKNIQANIREIKNKGFELNVLYAIVKKISESIYLEELKVVVVDILIELMDCDRCIIFTPSLKAGVYEITEMSKGREPFKSLITLDEIAKAPEREGEEMIALLAKWVNNEKISTPTLSADALIASLPLVIRDSRLGLIVAVRDAANPFDEEGFRLVTVAKDHLAVAFENARLYTLAITDELTHLFTVRHFQSQMEIEISRFLRYGQTCSLLMLDIDKFKAVNDTYGHPAGDKVLKEVATAIRNNLREIDIPCRYGGEEFTVILPGTSENGARLVAERIRKSLEKTVIHLNETQEISVTISIGGACCPDHGTAVKDMVVTADKALYRAKEAGRNKVFWGT